MGPFTVWLRPGSAAPPAGCAAGVRRQRPACRACQWLPLPAGPITVPGPGRWDRWPGSRLVSI